MKKNYFSVILLFTLYLISCPALSDELSEEEIIDNFSGKTMTGDHLQNNYRFKRYYDPNGDVIDISEYRGERNGTWKIKNNKLCHRWRKKNKCRKIFTDGDILQLYNKRGNIATINFRKYAEGNKLDEINISDVAIYEGPMIDGHAHLAGDYDIPFMHDQNEQHQIIKMVVIPRLFNDRSSDGTTEKAASEFAIKYKDITWVLVGLQRRDLFELNWNNPRDDWYQDWLKWARTEIQSGRRRGLGELTAVHYAYNDSEFAERNFPIESVLVDDLLKLSSETQRPLVLHAEGEPDVVSAIKNQLKKHPQAILVWAHACGRSSPLLVGKLLQTYPNLYCDLANMTDTGNYGSLWPRAEEWTYQWEKSGEILPEWIKVLEQFPDRFYIGMDSNKWKGWKTKGIKGRVSRISRFRAVLPQLSEKTIELITTIVPNRLYGDR